MALDRNIPERMGYSADYGEFIIIRPKLNYRINSGIIVVKGQEPFIIDTGTPSDPGIIRIKRALIRHKIEPNKVKYVFVTHSHQDHCMNLKKLLDLCPNAKSIVPKEDLYYVQNPALLPKSWEIALKYLGKDRLVRTGHKLLQPPLMMLFYRTIDIYSPINYIHESNFSNHHFELSKCKKIKTSDNEITIIPTPGHSAGHMSILDQNKNLYLGDFIPFTPWVNPLAEALDDMIQSIKNIISLNEDQVKLAVRSHGDVRRSKNYKGKLSDNGPWYSNNATWEVAEWSEEKARFEYWLHVINSSLERIPKLLKYRDMNFFDLCETLIPGYSRYNIFMKLFFIPPSLTWTLAYCLKLEKEGKIKRKYKGKHIYWHL